MKITIEQTFIIDVLGHKIEVDPLGPNFQETLEFVSQLSGIDMTYLYEIVRTQARQDLDHIFDVSRETLIL